MKILLTSSGFEQVIISLFFFDQHLTVIVFQFGQIQKGFLTKKKNVQFKNSQSVFFSN